MTETITYNVSRLQKTTILVGRNVVDSWQPVTKFQTATAIVDDNVADLHADLVERLLSNIAFKTSVLPVCGGEATKTLEPTSRLINKLAATGLTRDNCIVAIGGGTIMDICSFVAQLLLRGLPLILIPTTLLSQVDAAIGCKNGINVQGKKNLIGSFYFPQCVVCDSLFLETLPKRQFQSGIAEMIKVFAVSDLTSLSDLEFRNGVDPFFKSDSFLNVVARSIRMKVELLQKDPFELSPQRLLNFGHTFAHYFEECSNFCLTHGEAVMLSMLCEVEMSYLAGHCSSDIKETVSRVIICNLTDACHEFELPEVKIVDGLLNMRSFRGGHDEIAVPSLTGYGSIVSDIHCSIAMDAWKNVSETLSKARCSYEKK